MYNNPFEDFGPSERQFPHMPGGQFPGGGQFPPVGPFPPGNPPVRPPQPDGGFGPPFGPPGQPPVGGQHPPAGPPPSFTPAFPATQAYAGGMNRCLFRNTYVWLRNGRSFWFYPISVTRDMIIGFRWSNRRGWIFRSIHRDNILTFTCYFF